MAKLTKKALSELDAAIDQLGGGSLPILPPARARRAATPRKAAKKAVKKAVKKVAKKTAPKKARKAAAPRKAAKAPVVRRKR